MRSSSQLQTVLTGAALTFAVVFSVLAAAVLATWDQLPAGPLTPPAGLAAVTATATPRPPTMTATPTRTPSPSATATPSSTPTPSPTATPEPPSPTPSAIAPPVFVASPTGIPLLSTRTPAPQPCGPPAGWVRVRVLPGETLYRLAVRYGTTIGRLQQANCMGRSTILFDHQLLWVPPVMVISPTPAPLSPTPIEVTPTPS